MADDIKKTEIHGNRFGQTAVEMGLATIQQVKEALAQQVEDNINNRTHRLIGKIMMENGWITPEDVLKVLDKVYLNK
ncbi:MAG: hypothetical protein ISR96_08905 [Nitrospira sp.]|nr:hypothetical protein [bacterium]MBL7049618.1 hypothetical protein [Nitrospira sp.]